ncbi:MAG TPA: chromate efflux transporter [Candidatus Dormibacteraeota bacterium]|nr:chromate efflux transporter [Candidatus Dormibacteraeota bacterium]
MNDSAALQEPSFKEALRFWSKLGWITFGGTAAHIAIMQDELVEKKRWISNESLLHALSHCMILPGPEAQQLSIYIGWKLHGKRGGIVAGTLFVLPSMFILLALSVVYVRFGTLAWVAAMFGGLKLAVIALVIVALLRIGSKALHGPVHVVVAMTTFAAMFFFDVSLLVLMFAVVALGVVRGRLRFRLDRSTSETPAAEDEDSHSIRQSSTPPEPFALLPLIKLVVSVVLLWLAPLLILYLFVNDFHFWAVLVLFFTKTAFVTVGGSYTVIPYVAQVAVTKLQWLSKLQMMDGFALAETTPGPLIIVVAFVGFLAAYNHFNGSVWMGILGLLATTFYTFLPCFFFVFAGAPLVERTQNQPMIKTVLGLITAVVVGAILDLTVFLGKGVIFPSGVVDLRHLSAVAVCGVLVSLLLLQKFKMKVIPLVLSSAAFGLLRHFLSNWAF